MDTRDSDGEPAGSEGGANEAIHIQFSFFSQQVPSAFLLLRRSVLPGEVGAEEGVLLGDGEAGEVGAALSIDDKISRRRKRNISNRNIF